MGSGKMQQQLQKVDKIIFQEAEGISVSFVLVLITPLHFFFSFENLDNMQTSVYPGF